MNITSIHKSDDKNAGFAFFDVDDTVVSIKTMFSFQDYWYAELKDYEGEKKFIRDMKARNEPGACWEDLNRRYYQHFSGRSVSTVAQYAERWFDALLKSDSRLFNNNVVAELHAHQSAGREPVFVSGSFPALLNPIAKHLSVKYMLTINMQVEAGSYTGEILGVQTIGPGKAKAIDNFLKQHGVRAGDCYAYGDDISDAPMLEYVGHPIVIKGGRGLEKLAIEKSWKQIEPY